jgi:subtilase family serine protease
MQSSRSTMLKWACVVASFISVTPILRAQTAVPSRIAEAINNTNRVVIRGNVHPYARPQYDRGLTADSLPMERMLLVLKRSAAQEAALTVLLSAQQDPSSPQYHQWLTPEEFGRRFGPADADITAITDWLSSQGFRINGVSPARTVVDFSGTAGQVRNAFRTEVHRYVVNGEEHWANTSDPQIPAALAPVVAGVNSLHNFPLRPLHHLVGTFSKSRSTGEVGPLTPSFVFPGCASSCNAVGPYDFATIYNVLPLWNAGIDGTGELIAIAQNTNINVQDVHNFRSLFGLPANDPRVLLNGLDPGITGREAEAEADLDVEWAGAVAKNAAIDLIVSASGATDGADLSAQYIADTNFASIMSVSFGLCELFLGTTGNQQINQLWQQAAAEGITVVVAAGDEGSAGCEDIAAPGATTGLGVNGLASTPFNIAVGGTSFDDLANPSLFWNSTNNSTTQASAKGYIPETTWNDSCTNAQLALLGFMGNAEANCNDPKAQQDGFLAVLGGGGGASGCTAVGTGSATACSGGGYAKPPWQAGPGVPSDGKRDVPDVSLFSGGPFGSSFYIICQMDQDPGGQACSLSTPLVTFEGIVGTSASAPAFAGIMAMVDQKTGSRQGNANPFLYKLANSGASCVSSATPAGSCMFYDVTSGTIAMPCVKASPDCTVSGASDQFGVLNGFNAGANYDLATGLGSVNAANLVNNWPPSSGPTIGTPGFQLLSSSLTISIPAAGQTGSATITVTGLSGFSGFVNLSCTVSPAVVADEPTCSFSPSAVALDAATIAAPTTLNIGSTARQKSSIPAVGDAARPMFLIATAMIAFAFIFVIAACEKRRRAILLGLASIILLGAVAGCGGNSAGTTTLNSGTPSGNYLVTITATSGKLKQTTNLFVTIP